MDFFGEGLRDAWQLLVHGDVTVKFTPDEPIAQLIFRVWANGPRTASAGAHESIGAVTVDGVHATYHTTDPTTLVVELRQVVHAGDTVTAMVAYDLQLPGAAQDRRSLSGAAGVEEHAAELDCRGGDRGRVLAALDALRKRSDRLRCAGASERLPELEHHPCAVTLNGRLVKGTGEKGGRPACVAQGQCVASSVPQQRHRLSRQNVTGRPRRRGLRHPVRPRRARGRSPGRHRSARRPARITPARLHP